MEKLNNQKISNYEFYPILKNQRKYNRAKLHLLRATSKEYGYGVFTDSSLPDNFDYSSLSVDYFYDTYTQTFAIPLSDDAFKTLTSLPKKAINTPFIFNRGDKRICGQYMIGNLKGKPVLYAFSIIQADNNSDEFNIKLDVCVNGKDWVQLARLDSQGAPHPNYYDENSFAKSQLDVTYVPAPHIHYCIQRSQVLNGTKFDYMPAKHVDLQAIHEQNGCSMLQNGLEYFLKFTNVHGKIKLDAVNSNNYQAYIFEGNEKDNCFIYSKEHAKKFISTYLTQNVAEK